MQWDRKDHDIICMFIISDVFAIEVLIRVNKALLWWLRETKITKTRS